MSTVQFLNTDGGERIAYEKIEGGVGHPTLLYVPGYGGTKDGDKVKVDVSAWVSC